MKRYADLEKEQGIVDKLMPADYEHAVHLLAEDFELVWKEVQGWRPDMFERYMLKQIRLMEQLHEVVEQGLKILLKIRGDFVDRPKQKDGDKHHDLSLLFHKVPELDQGILRRQFDIYVSLYDHIGDVSLDDYLSKWGQGGLYIRNRLAAVEAVGQSAEAFAQNHEEMHPWVMAELAQAVVSILEAKAYADHGLRTIDCRLDVAVQTAVHDAYETVINMRPADGGNSAITAMPSFVKDRGGWINAAVYLIRSSEIADGDEYLQAWLTSAKKRLQADSADAPQSLDMRLFLARAARESVRWDATRGAFLTKGSKYEAYTVFDGDVPYVLRWQQGGRSGCIRLDRDGVPDWRRPPERGAQITLSLNGKDVREFADSVNWEDATDFVLLRDGEERMVFLALVVSMSGASWGTTNMDVLDLKEVRVRLLICHQGDGYSVLSMQSGEHGTLPRFWTGYRLVTTEGAVTRSSGA